MKKVLTIAAVIASLLGVAGAVPAKKPAPAHSASKAKQAAPAKAPAKNLKAAKTSATPKR